MEQLTIGEVAKRANVKVKNGTLLRAARVDTPPPRRESGYREYPEETTKRIRFIKRTQELGFSLKEVAELLALRVDPKTTCGEIRKVAAAKMTDIEGKIRFLQRMKDVLTKLVAACSGLGPTSDCPILEALESAEDANCG